MRLWEEGGCASAPDVSGAQITRVYTFGEPDVYTPHYDLFFPNASSCIGLAHVFGRTRILCLRTSGRGVQTRSPHDALR